MSSARGATAVLCGLVLASSALAACSSATEPASDEDYLAEAAAVAESFTEGVQAVARQVSEIDKLDLAAAAVLLQTFSDRVEALTDRIERIRPPAAVEALHLKLIGLLDEFEGKAQAAAIALKAGDLLGGLPALAEFVAEAAQVRERLDGVLGSIRERLGLAAAPAAPGG